MLVSTKAVVLSRIKYGESDIIAKLFTQKFGLKSYIVKGARKKNAKNKSTLLSPMLVVNITCYQKEGKTLQVLKEISLENYFQTNLLSHPKKVALGVFFAEVFAHAIHEDESDIDLFEFIESTSQSITEIEEGYKHFVLQTLWRFTRYLGIFPADASNKLAKYFNIASGEFSFEPFSEYPISEQQSAEIKEFLLSPFNQNPNKSVSTQALQIALDYLAYHLPYFKQPKSWAVFKSVFN